MIVSELADGIVVERARYGPGTDVSLDAGRTEMRFDSASLLEQPPATTQLRQ